MEIVKNRVQPIWQQIKHRAELSAEELSDLNKNLLGLNGEILFEKIIQTYMDNGLIYQDLHLQIFNKEFQIDCLAVMQDEIYIFEVKWTHYDVTLHNGSFYFTDRMAEIEGYALQKVRTQKLMARFLDYHQLNYKVHYFHVFINPAQRVYGVQKNNNCLSYFDSISLISQLSKVPNFYSHEQLQSILLQEHMLSSRHSKCPALHFNEAKKGVLCLCEQDFIQRMTERQFKCSCGKVYTSEDYLKLAVEELRRLFNDESFTVQRVHEWIDGNLDKRTVRRFLCKYFVKRSNCKGAYYTSH
ncbi:nuclease-related domain-containing protein [Macrococcus bovicus]|uniref:NERD domain-containing protein n=1 Tax=Macrococcus bovicus TaxID=69968 RepID=A0A4R6C394_9STAP|nr:nuclease-related domain-containing protein [Macrococcus bovicus]TDM15842.1 NERD domain-containing protein [Macrococcus bovicus]